jgi:hypothetical protein
MRPGMFDHPLFEFGFSREPWALVALGLGILLFGAALRRTERRALGPRFAWLLSLGAAALSLLYFRDFLRGGPRIIDATAYLLEARTFASGAFTFRPPVPSDLFVGRFLLRAAEAPAEIGVIFPPGYPVVLALFERLASYRVLGPLLAFLIGLVTYQLTLQLERAELEGTEPERAQLKLAGPSSPAPLLAAALSALSMTLRYHTADTMSHGLSTLLTAVLLWLGLGGLGRRPTFRALVFGGGAGLLFATRPLTALAVFVAMVSLGWRRLRSLRPWALGLGLLPGLVLYAFYQKALTGSYFGSAQLNYYLAADGPGQCFGLGFGKGCLFEHGDVIEERGTLGPLWAILNSLHRLHQHSLDIANFEPIALALAFFLWRERKSLKSRLAFSVLASLVVSYAFFYFDGSYPGGGARFLVEALPLEHACLALLAVPRGWSLGLVGLSLLGFAGHGVFSHVALRERDGGAPFLAQELATASEPRVIFVKSDHAFLSGFDPRAFDENGHVRRTLVARRSDDARQWRLIQNLSHPEAFRTLREPTRSPADLELMPQSELDPPAAEFEAERAWPPLELRGAWGHPIHRPEACLSQGGGLALWRDSTRPGPPALELWLDVPLQSYDLIVLHLWSKTRGCFQEFIGVQKIPTLPGPLTVELGPLLDSASHPALDPGAEPELILDSWEYRSAPRPAF